MEEQRHKNTAEGNREKSRENREKSKVNRGNSRERSGDERRRKEENSTIENSDSGMMTVEINSCNRETTQLRH